MTSPAALPAPFASAALLLVAACGAPSRQLPRRIVDDPVTPPKGMLQVHALAGVRVDPGAARSRGYILPGTIRYGITDRLAVENLTLRYALLDDAPAAYASTGAAAARAPLSLSVWGGLSGVGWQRGAGFGFAPGAGAALGRRVHRRLRVRASGAWAEWIRRDQTIDLLWGVGGLSAQLTDFVSVHLDAEVGRGDARRWTRSHGFGRRWGRGALGLGLRSKGPVTLFFGVHSERVQHELPPRSPPSPIETIADQSPRHGRPIGGWGWTVTALASW
jgi:hypothetical protein